jgi:hypothetical protein
LVISDGCKFCGASGTSNIKKKYGDQIFFHEIGASEPAEMDKGTVAKSPFGKRCFPNFLSMTQNFAADKICLDHI